MKTLLVSLGKTHFENPTLDVVLKLLEELKGSLSQFDLDFLGNAKPGDAALSIMEDSGLYLPMIQIYREGGSEIFQYKNSNADDSWIEFSAYEYPTEIMTDDFNLIVSMVKEFYETGMVKALNHQYDF